MENNEKKELIKFNLLREDSLNNNRLTWLLAFQGILFAANTFSTNNSVLIPILGFVTSFISLCLVLLGIYSINQLHKIWFSMLTNKDKEEKPLSPFGIQIPGKGYLILLFGLSSLLPLSCTIAWFIIIW